MLEAARCRISGGAFITLAAALRCRKTTLATLTLSHNPLTDKSVVAVRSLLLTASSDGGALGVVDLFGCLFGVHGAAQLVMTAARCHKLRHLDVSGDVDVWRGQGRGSASSAGVGLDVSGSVDATEYRLQLDGLAAALEHPETQDALFNMPGATVALAVYQWGAPDQQQVLVGWTDMSGPSELLQVTARLRSADVRFTDPYTGLGAAMRFGAAMLAQRGDCWRHTLDISGDGPSNAGPHPDTVAMDTQAQITVNALVINPNGRDNVTKDLTSTRTLLDHYRTHVLRGSGAFAETAQSFADFEAAMARKLLRELRPPALSQLGAAAGVTLAGSVDIADLIGPIALDAAQ
jgi:hypothetical protein